MKKLKNITAFVLSSIMLAFFMMPLAVMSENELNTDYKLYGRDNFDVVFVLDGSGSMKTADKNKLAAEMVELFIRLSDYETCRAGFVEYSDTIEAAYDLTEMKNDDARNDFISKVKAIDYAPNADTDIALGLSKALEIHKKGMESGDDLRQPFIILLSDGRTDLPKSGQRSVEESDAELISTTEELKSMKIPVFTVGLNSSKDDPNIPESKKLDAEAMKRIAEQTGAKRIINEAETAGTYEVTKAEQLLGVVTDIFSQVGKIKPEDIEPKQMEDNWLLYPFDIENNSVFFANIYIDYSGPPEDMRLIAPDDSYIPLSKMNDASEYGKIDYSSTDNYALIKITHPMVGPWQLWVKNANNADINVTFLQTYDLFAVQTPSANLELITGDIRHFAAFLSTEKGRVSDPDLIATLNASLEIRKNGEEPRYEVLDSNNDGSFSGDIRFAEEGKFIVKTIISASDGSFRKESPAVYVTVMNAFSGSSAKQILSSEVAKAASEPIEITAGLYHNSVPITEKNILDSLTATVYIKSTDLAGNNIEPIAATVNDEGLFSASFTPPQRGLYSIYTIFKNTSDMTEIQSNTSILTATRQDILLKGTKHITVYSGPFSTEEEIRFSDCFSWDPAENIITESEIDKGGFTINSDNDPNDPNIVIKGSGSGSGSCRLSIRYSDSEFVSTTVYVTVKNGFMSILKVMIGVGLAMIAVMIVRWIIHPSFNSAMLDFSLIVPPSRTDVAQPAHFRMNIPAGAKKINLMSALRNDNFNYPNISDTVTKLKIGNMIGRITIEAGRNSTVIVKIKRDGSDPVVVNGAPLDSDGKFTVASGESFIAENIDGSSGNMTKGSIRIRHIGG